MASVEQSKQTNVRLPVAYHERLQEAARAQGKAPGTLARELLIQVLDGSAPAQSNLDSELLLERMDSIEDGVRDLGDTFHVALRSLLKSLLVPLENDGAQKTLDMVLGPTPTLKRN